MNVNSPVVAERSMPEVGEVAAMPAEEAVRANTYGLLGALLAAAPGAELIGLLRQIDEVPAGPGEMGLCWQTLRLAAERADPEQVADEYQNLFIGLGHGEVVPYGSWYMTGFLMDKPLALLRRDLQELGFERQADVHEPEDHAAALCETLAMIIQSPDEISADRQRRFFHEHMAPWMARFFQDLQEAPSARFYRAVGRLGEQFIDIETQYLVMPA